MQNKPTQGKLAADAISNLIDRKIDLYHAKTHEFSSEIIDRLEKSSFGARWDLAEVLDHAYNLVSEYVAKLVRIAKRRNK